MSFHVRLLGLVTLSFALLGALFGHHLLINTTHSMPVGIYWKTAAPPERGSIVSYRLDPTAPAQEVGFARGYDIVETPLIKRVAALTGDVVSVTAIGMSVNGKWIADSAPAKQDRGGRALRQALISDYTLKPGEVLLCGETPTSWDSRYFGVVALSRCSGTYVPLFTLP